MDLFIGQKVYHKEIYDGKELMTVVGIREIEVELEGDYSGGTHNVCQKDWLPIDGVIETNKCCAKGFRLGYTCPFNYMGCKGCMHYA